ncbi:MAG TPA: ABC transporter permease [Acidobacteriota bacterium]|nr:ABC transporter permease [Acidobacteriota bacterium]
MRNDGEGIDPTLAAEIDGEIEEEISFHLQMRMEANMKKGMSRQEARAQALRQFGDPQDVRRQGRRILASQGSSSRGRAWFAALGHDLQFGLRQLRRHPGFALVAMVTLALGIGANTAIFSVVDSVLLKPLPYQDPERLFMLWERPPEYPRNSVSPRTFLDWREQSRSFESMAAFSDDGVVVTRGGEPEQISGAAVSPGFFRLLGVDMALGTGFLPESRQSGEPTVILTHALWQSRFGGDPALVGQTITVDGKQMPVVGILEPGPLDRRPAQLYFPLIFDPSQVGRASHYLTVYARLAQGRSLSQAQSEMDAIAAAIAEESPETNKDWGVRIDPLRERIVASDLAQSLWVLFAAVLLVLSIACVNVANLNLVRASEREREVALRSALGAGRLRLLRQFLVENLLLALAGGALGVAVAHWTLRLFSAWIPPGTLPAEAQVQVDWRVLAFALAVSLLTGLISAGAPAWRAWRQDPNETLKRAGRTSLPGTGQRRSRSLLLVTETALALVLLVGSGLLIRSLWQLQQSEIGLDPENVLSFHISLPYSKYSEAQASLDFFQRLRENVEALPGVESTALVTQIPVTFWNNGLFFSIEGETPVDVARRPGAHFQRVSPGYFRTMGIALLQGRDFSPRDAAGGPLVAIVNETLVKRHIPSGDPIGRRIAAGSGDFARSYQIIGVVGDVQVYGLAPGAQPDAPEIYVPLVQAPFNNSFLVLRTDGQGSDPQALTPAVREQVRRIDPQQPITQVRSMQEVAAASLSDERFITLLLGAFALTALILASVGIYSVVAFVVSRLTHQIGIRRALGALDRHVVALVLQQGLRPALWGILLGTLLALGLGGVISSLLHQVSPADPLILAASALLLVATTLLALAVPGSRASRVQPVVALRSE